VTSFIEDNPEQVVDQEAKFNEKPRRLDFDNNNHKSLNAELKYLYTAITRAKCNLWIYDSDKDRRLPVFDYWSKRGLVKVIKISDISNDDHGSLFSATSTKDEWKSQGDYFRRKRLWEPAMKCYQKAECPHLESESRAYSLAQQARTPGLKSREKEGIYIQSAYAFLKCDQSQHDYQCLDNAAKCLKNAKKYEESSQMYLLLGQVRIKADTTSSVTSLHFFSLRLLKPEKDL
jgi:ATP-dependent exoDNAse (exonuclease V) beta subunit